MLEKFKPTWMVKTIYNVPPMQLKEAGIRAVFSDLDNTLIAWNNPNGTVELHDWIRDLKEAGIPLIVISNNSSARVKKAVAALSLPYVSRSLKPLSWGINNARKRLNLHKDEVVMVGDQLMTDVLASNNAGIRSILVKPLIESDKWITVPNRLMGNAVMKKLEAAYPQLKWQEDLND